MAAHNWCSYSRSCKTPLRPVLVLAESVHSPVSPQTRPHLVTSALAMPKAIAARQVTLTINAPFGATDSRATLARRPTCSREGKIPDVAGVTPVTPRRSHRRRDHSLRHPPNVHRHHAKRTRSPCVIGPSLRALEDERRRDNQGAARVRRRAAASPKRIWPPPNEPDARDAPPLCECERDRARRAKRRKLACPEQSPPRTVTSQLRSGASSSTAMAVARPEAATPRNRVVPENRSVTGAGYMTPLTTEGRWRSRHASER